MPSSHPRPSSSASSDSSFDEADDQDWADWVDDVEGNDGSRVAAMTYGGEQEQQQQQQQSNSGSFKVPTRALFGSTTFDSPLEALRDAKSTQGVDLVAIVKRLHLDALQVIRLVNYIRRNQASVKPDDIKNLTGKEKFLDDEAELKPVEGLEDDGLLQLDFDELDDGGDAPASSGSSSSTARVQELESQLHATRLAFQELQQRYMSQIGLSSELSASADDRQQQQSTSRATATSPIAGSSKTRPIASGQIHDDDTHYFNSYASNDIHQIMIEDSVRTLTYAQFLLHPRNAHLIKGKTVMDIGCGSGILSLFAARAGAKQVIAIDASDVADRARENIDANGFGHVIKVFKGKVEDLANDLAPYKGKIDLMVSEWMGYFLLYESMLPSVLLARDNYLNPETGTLAPSHCRMLLSAVSDETLLHQRIKFWEDVHGFKMPAMSKGLEIDSYVEGLKSDAIISDVVPILDLPLQEMNASQPSFVSPFVLEIHSTGTVHGFLSWFDTWFLAKSQHPRVPDAIWKANEGQLLKGGVVIPDLPPVTTEPITAKDVEGIHLTHNATQRDPTTQETDAGPVPISFTTGPQGLETHWKQTVFLLKEAIQAEKGNVIAGEIHVFPTRKGARELDAEIHYVVRASREEHQKREQGQIKKVEAVCVQSWAVR